MSAISARPAAKSISRGATGAPIQSITAPSCAKKSGTALSQSRPAEVGIRHNAERFQVRICWAGPVRRTPWAASRSSAQASSSAGPPGRAQPCRNGWSASGSPDHGLNGVGGGRSVSAR